MFRRLKPRRGFLDLRILDIVKESYHPSILRILIQTIFKSSILSELGLNGFLDLRIFDILKESYHPSILRILIQTFFKSAHPRRIPGVNHGVVRFFCLGNYNFVELNLYINDYGVLPATSIFLKLKALYKRLHLRLHTYHIIKQAFF